MSFLSKTSTPALSFPSFFGRFYPLGKASLDAFSKGTTLLSEHHCPGFPQCTLCRRSHTVGSQQHKKSTQFLQYQPVLYFSETPHLHQHRIGPPLLSLDYLSPNLDIQLFFLHYWDAETCCILHFMGSLFTHVLLQESDSASKRESTNSTLCRAFIIKRSLKKKKAEQNNTVYLQGPIPRYKYVSN